MKLPSSVDRFAKNTEMSNFMKTRHVVAEFSHAHGQTDTTNAPKNTLKMAFERVETRSSVLM
jgi:hypothetical protein